MATIKIEFETGNAAFDDYPQEECAAVLNRLAVALQREGAVTPGRSLPLRDHNGNRVGWCHIEDNN